MKISDYNHKGLRLIFENERRERTPKEEEVTRLYLLGRATFAEWFEARAGKGRT